MNQVVQKVCMYKLDEFLNTPRPITTPSRTTVTGGDCRTLYLWKHVQWQTMALYMQAGPELHDFVHPQSDKHTQFPSPPLNQRVF